MSTIRNHSNMDDYDIESSGDGCYRNSDALFGSLAELRHAGKFCDAVIKVKNQSYPIHRNIMSACSPYFKSLFTKTNTHRKEMTLPGATEESVRMLIDFAYTRTAAITPDNVERLLSVCDQYHVAGMLRLCCEYLRRNLGTENCLGILGIAKHHHCTALEKSAFRYTLKHFGQVYTRSNEYLQQSLDVVCALLSSDLLNVSCEEFVFDAVCRWVDFDPPNRRRHMQQLLATVRLGLLPSPVFDTKVKGHVYVKDEPGCQPLIADTEAFLSELDKCEEPDFDMSLPFARPRLPHEILFVIGGWSGGRPISMVETYDTRADRWVVCNAEDTGPRAYHGVVSIGCLIYVIGGFDATECFSSCRVFNAGSKTWAEIAPMNQKRSYVSVALLNGYIYAMGGFEGPPRTQGDSLVTPRLRSVERFEPRANQWTRLASMKERRSDAGATAFQGKVFICGGFDGYECLSSAEVYCPVTDQWTTIPPMSSRRSGVGVVAYQGNIYAAGGFDGGRRVTTVEKYCHTEKSWSSVADMYNSRSNFAIEVIDEMLFVIGGFNGETTIYNVECYDSQSNEWYNATDMNLYKSALSACVVRDLPDVRDFVYKKSEVSSNRGGSTGVSNRDGSIDGSNRGGSNTVSNRGGSNELSNRGGSLSNRGGSTEVSNRDGSIEISNQRNTMEISNESGSMEVSNRDGSVEVSNERSSIEVSSQSGSTDVSNADGYTRALHQTVDPAHHQAASSVEVTSPRDTPTSVAPPTSMAPSSTCDVMLDDDVMSLSDTPTSGAASPSASLMSTTL